MQQLSGLDATFLNIESNACPMHVGGLIIMERLKPKPEDGGYGRLFHHIESRLDLIPPLRRRLFNTPMGIDHPYWIEAPDFDLVQHVKHRAIPSPGNQRNVSELVCELASTRLDRNLPLWEINFVEGLKGGRVAVITKMHHAAIDGVSGAEILGNLLDLTPTPREVKPPRKPWQPDRIPTLMRVGRLTARSLAQRPGKAARLARDSASLLMSSGRGLLDRRKLSGKWGGLMPLAPRTRFNRQISARRSFAYGSLELDAIKQVKNSFGATVNDVVMAVCGAALRAYLDEKGELPEKSLIAGVPMSTRTEEQEGSAGNQVTFLRATLHTDEADIVTQLRRISDEMAGAKKRMRAMAANLMGDWAQLPAPALMARAARLYENFSIQDYHTPAFNVVISNVPGPNVPLYFAGMKVLANHPVSIPYHGIGFNITLMSYCGKLDFGLTADQDSLPDIEHFAELMHTALNELLKRSSDSN